MDTTSGRFVIFRPVVFRSTIKRSSTSSALRFRRSSTLLAPATAQTHKQAYSPHDRPPKLLHTLDQSSSPHHPRPIERWLARSSLLLQYPRHGGGASRHHTTTTTPVTVGFKRANSPYSPTATGCLLACMCATNSMLGLAVASAGRRSRRKSLVTPRQASPSSQQGQLTAGSALPTSSPVPGTALAPRQKVRSVPR